MPFRSLRSPKICQSARSCSYVTTVSDILSASPPAAARAGAFHLSPEWFASWDAAYLRDDQRPLDIAGIALLDETARVGPLRYRRRRARTNLQTAAFDVAPGTTPDADLPRALLGNGVDVAMLDYVPSGSALLAAARTWPGSVHVAPHARAPAADCRDGYEAWLARRSKRVRHRWPRLEAHVVDTLGMTYHCLETFDDLPALLLRLFAVEASGWKGRDGTAIVCNPADRQFYTTLAHRAAAAGVLRIAMLRQGERIAAFEYSIFGGERLYVLKVGYDEAFEDASIGHVLAAIHIRDCCADPRIAWYDKLGNGMTPAPYKLRFADEIETLHRITLYAPGWRAQAVRLHDAARRRAKRLRDRWRARKRPT